MAKKKLKVKAGYKAALSRAKRNYSAFKRKNPAGDPWVESAPRGQKQDRQIAWDVRRGQKKSEKSAALKAQAESKRQAKAAAPDAEYKAWKKNRAKQLKERYPNEPWNWKVDSYGAQKRTIHFKRDANGKYFWATATGKAKLVNGKKFYISKEKAKRVIAGMGESIGDKMKRLVPGYVEPGYTGSKIKIKRQRRGGEATWDKQAGSRLRPDHTDDARGSYKALSGEFGKDNIGYSFSYSAGGPGTKSRGSYKTSKGRKKQTSADIDREFASILKPKYRAKKAAPAPKGSKTIRLTKAERQRRLDANKTFKKSTSEAKFEREIAEQTRKYRRIKKRKG